jgi:hypothetical protein
VDDIGEKARTMNDGGEDEEDERRRRRRGSETTVEEKTRKMKEAEKTRTMNLEASETASK